MLYTHFPAPVSFDETCLVVHRPVTGLAHQEQRTCWCCPHVFTQDELATLTADQLNERTRSGMQ